MLTKKKKVSQASIKKLAGYWDTQFLKDKAREARFAEKSARGRGDLTAAKSFECYAIELEEAVKLKKKDRTQ